MTQLTNQKWYCDSSKYSSAAQWAATTSYTAGRLVRQLATPSTGSERVFACIVAGTSGSSEPTWTTTYGAKTTDNTVTWMEVTGKAGVNGDLTNTNNWTSVKGAAITLGTLIQTNSGSSLQICTTAGTAGSGSQPSFSDTAGTTTTDNTVTWTSLGAPSNFGVWAAPWARLNLAFVTTAFALGSDTVFVGSGHAETQTGANIAYVAPNSGLSVICVSNSTGSLPTTTLATTGSLSTTGAYNVDIGAATSGNVYIYGINFNAGSSTNAAYIEAGGPGSVIFENCSFNLNNTASTSVLYLGQISANSGYVQLRNCTMTFGSTSQVMAWPTPRVDIYGGSIASSGSIPTTLVSNAVNQGGKWRIMDCDLSALTGTLFTVTSNAVNTEVSLENCKLNSGVTIVNGSPGVGNAIVKVHNSDSANTNYRYGYYKFPGSVVHNTSITRSGGAGASSTPLSWQLATTSSASYYYPFTTEEITQLNSMTGSSHTATVQITTNTALTNATCWLELEYPGNTSYPLGSTVSSRAAPLATPSSLATSSATWNGTAQTYIYQLQVTFTPQQAGPIKARIYLAAPSATVYVDPLILIV